MTRPAAPPSAKPCRVQVRPVAAWGDRTDTPAKATTVPAAMPANRRPRVARSTPNVPVVVENLGLLHGPGQQQLQPERQADIGVQWLAEQVAFDEAAGKGRNHRCTKPWRTRLNLQRPQSLEPPVAGMVGQLHPVMVQILQLGLCRRCVTAGIGMDCLASPWRSPKGSGKLNVSRC